MSSTPSSLLVFVPFVGNYFEAAGDQDPFCFFGFLYRFGRWTTKNPVNSRKFTGLMHFYGRCCTTIWCRRPDSNRHGSPHTPLKRARLPIPPLRQFYSTLIRWFFCISFCFASVLGWRVLYRFIIDRWLLYLNLSMLTH